jgi:multiple sugar transport system substrate-binding protein
LRKRSLSLIVIMIMLAALGMGCGNIGGKSKEVATDAETIKKNNEPAELVVFSTSGDSGQSWNDRFGDAIKKKFPNYSVKYIQAQKNNGIKELLTAGQQIDIYWDSIGGFSAGLIDNDMQYDMTDLIKKHNIDLSLIEPTAVDAIKQISGGKIYGVPIFNNDMVLYYNKDIFDKFGAPYPKDGMTWDEANELAKKVTGNMSGVQYVGLSSSGTHMLLMNQLSIPFVDAKLEKATINSNDNWKKFYETVFVGPAKSPGYIDYMKDHKNSTPYRDEFLKARELAMFAWLSSIVFVFPDEYQSLNWDVVSLPTFKDKPGIGSQAYPTFFSVTSTSKFKDQATEVIKYLASDETQTRLSKIGVMPVINKDEIKKVYGQESKFKDKNLKTAFYNKFAPIPPKTKYDSLLLSPYAHAINDSIISGDMNTIFRKTEEDSNKKIDAAK